MPTELPSMIDYHEPLMADDQAMPKYLQHDRVNLVQQSPQMIAERIEQANGASYHQSGDVAIIPIHGMIEYKLSIFGWLYGGTSCQMISRSVSQAIANPDISRIVFDVDSPGGSYSGVPECEKMIFDARSKIDTIAIANPLAASAAVRIASAAERFVVLGSGQVGSVGTFTVVGSYSRQLQEAGIDAKVIRSPKHKAENHPAEPLSEEYIEHQQGIVDQLTDEFHAIMAKHRGVKVAKVKSDFGQGRMMFAKQAVAAGLCDGISSLDQELTRGNRRSSGRSRTRQEEPKSGLSQQDINDALRRVASYRSL